MIREATQKDIPAIRALMKAEPSFWQEEWRTDVLERGLEAAAGLAFVYVQGEEVIGFVSGHDLGFRAYLSELIVAKAHKSEGVGKQLMAHLESALIGRGCAVLIADVWKDARGFYEGLGWTSPDVILLRKRLTGKGSQPAAPVENANKSGSR
jgi:predicted N-acetyltransferase YhbS